MIVKNMMLTAERRESRGPSGCVLIVKNMMLTALSVGVPRWLGCWGPLSDVRAPEAFY